MTEINRTLFNYIVGTILIILTLPLQFVIAVILMIELKEFPIFVQERGITLSYGRFRMLKFKTIKSYKTGESKLHKDFLIPADENHITLFANFLRKSGLDELLQLYNVLTGRMNLVGPRPLMFEDLVIMKYKYPQEEKIRESLNLKPGVTGLWQLFGDKHSGIIDLIKYDTMYTRKRTAMFDLKILSFTLVYVLRLGKKNLVENSQMNRIVEID